MPVLKQRIYLNDGPLDDIEVVGDHKLIGFITAINIEVAVPEPKRKQLRPEDIDFDDDDLAAHADLDEDDDDVDAAHDCDDNELTVDELNLETHRYDRFDSWTAKKENEIQHAFFHGASQSFNSPVTTDLWSRVNEMMTGPDRERWNHWRYTLFRSLENIRETARQFGCNSVVDQLEDCQTQVTDIPVMTVPD